MSNSIKTREDFLTVARGEITLVDADRAEALIAQQALVLRFIQMMH